MRTKLVLSVFALIGILCALEISSAAPPADSEARRIVQGYRIAPVPLKLRGRDRDLVGLGSYIVNAQGGCNDCHTNPPYAPGGDPFLGQPKKVNSEGYLAGGTPFGPTLVSANITPDENGLPHGLTWPEFKQVIRTGHDPDEPGEILQVMPWPVYQDMTNRDLRAIYEYLRSIPSIEGGEDDD
ncbi:MAG TPA: cytochrome C [Thermoanaerobaculia bacterium]|nr:cytochrome C [Thermoanaerobaculia bacterium]